eukprot:2993003-Rhodomonas_salina.1
MAAVTRARHTAAISSRLSRLRRLRVGGFGMGGLVQRDVCRVVRECAWLVMEYSSMCERIVSAACFGQA